jgi:hypothetical protein
MFQTKENTMTRHIAALLALAIFAQLPFAHADREEMSDMPILKPKATYAIPSQTAGETLSEQRGFGDQEPEVRMMNLMMVRGSGIEGMDMDQMKMADAKKPTPKSSIVEETIEMIQASASGKVGANTYEFSIKDISGKALKGLKVKAQVYMLSMDMGTESPKVKETKPGVYQTKVNFSMGGPWALKIITPSSEKVFEIQASK